jgi:UDP-N-acetylmuramyl pentapeptide phosphotransferase/UDP-N-acetylglucosamine-1-phosphate transferase
MIALQRFWITSVGFEGFDQIFLFAPLAIFLTLIWTSGLCHAFNLIDGLNGLAGFAAVITAGGLTAIAWLAGDSQMVVLCLILMAAVAGFLIHNWPRGRIFLGDGGAYSIGHLLAWAGLFLLYRNPDVSGISVALLYFWPVADTSWAIYRRRARGRRTDQPDRMHFHQVAMRMLEIRFGLRGKRHISNSLTSVLMTPFMMIPIAAGIVFYQAPMMALAALIVMGGGFILLYLSVYGFASRKTTRGQGRERLGEKENSTGIAAE